MNESKIMCILAWQYNYFLATLVLVTTTNTPLNEDYL